MNLSEAFSVSMNNKEIISFVGGGGKTSAIFRLARELKALGKQVLVTTTTAIYVPDPLLYDYLFIRNVIREERLQSVGDGSVTVIGQEITPENKLKGLPPETVDELLEQGFFDVILVEADGSKSRPIKAPDVHEPVIPQKTSILIGVIGFDCYGKSLDEEWVHRPQILAHLTGKSIGDIIDVDVILKLVMSHHGLFKNCPADAGKIVFFNKVLSIENFYSAQEIGNMIINGGHGSNGINAYSVVIGAVLDEPPVRCILKRQR